MTSGIVKFSNEDSASVFSDVIPVSDHFSKLEGLQSSLMIHQFGVSEIITS